MANIKTLKPLTAKKLDTVISDVYRKNCSGIQIDIMDISKVFKAGQAAYLQYINAPANDGTGAVAAITEAVIATVAVLRKN